MYPDHAVCQRCGMPLAYDRYLLQQEDRAAPSESDLCSYCSEGIRPEHDRTGRRTESEWILELIFRTYESRIPPGSRTLATALDKVPAGLPSNVRALTNLISSIPRKRADTTDVVVLYSGGKDSSWMLTQLAKRTNLSVTAWMLDQGYQSPAAVKNAQRLCDKLGVELVIAKPDRDPMDTLFRLGFTANETGDPELIRSAMTYGSACWPCFATIAAQATAYCRQVDAAFCFIGTQKGQNRMDLGGSPALSGGGLPSVMSLLDKFVTPLRKHAEKHAPESAELLQTYECRTALIPFYEFVAKPSYDEQIAQLEAVGWSMPKNTGACSTNCMMNELGRKIMRTQYGFDLYQIIDANENRLQEGAEPPPIAELDEDAVRRGAKMIGLTPVESQRYGLEEE